MRVGTWIEARPKLHIPGLIDSSNDECHITMAYLGSVTPDAAMDALTNPANNLYKQWPFESVIAEVNGTARWINADGDHVDVLLVSPPVPRVPGISTIHDLRNSIEYVLGRAGIIPDTLYPFTPHITMPNGWPADPRNNIPRIGARYMFAINELYVSSTSKENGPTNQRIVFP